MRRFIITLTAVLFLGVSFAPAMATNNGNGNDPSSSSSAISQSGPATTISGPASTVSGPATTISGPATTVSGPATTVSGPATTISGPATTNAGNIKNENNNKNSNKQGQAQGQAQGQKQGQKQGQGQAQGQNNGQQIAPSQDVKFEAEKPVFQAPTIVAPGLTAGMVTCLGSKSAGVTLGSTAVGVGGTFGTTVEDEKCNSRADAALLIGAGEPDVAKARLCQRPEMAEAYETAGKPCAKTAKQAAAIKAEPVVKQTSAPAAVESTNFGTRSTEQQGG